MLKTLIFDKEVMFDENGVFYTKDRKVYNKIAEKMFNKVKTTNGLYTFLNTYSDQGIIQLCYAVDKNFKLYTMDEELLKYRRLLRNELSDDE